MNYFNQQKEVSAADLLNMSKGYNSAQYDAQKEGKGRTKFEFRSKPIDFEKFDSSYVNGTIYSIGELASDIATVVYDAFANLYNVREEGELVGVNKKPPTFMIVPQAVQPLNKGMLYYKLYLQPVSEAFAKETNKRMAIVSTNSKEAFNNPENNEAIKILNQAENIMQTFSTNSRVQRNSGIYSFSDFEKTYGYTLSSEFIDFCLENLIDDPEAYNDMSNKKFIDRYVSVERRPAGNFGVNGTDFLICINNVHPSKAMELLFGDRDKYMYHFMPTGSFDTKQSRGRLLIINRYDRKAINNILSKYLDRPTDSFGAAVPKGYVNPF